MDGRKTAMERGPIPMSSNFRELFGFKILNINFKHFNAGMIGYSKIVTILCLIQIN